MKLGAAAYALFAILQIGAAILILLGFGPYAGGERWFLLVTAAVFGFSGVIYAVGAATRRGLAAEDGPWVCRRGWLVVIGLVAVGSVAAIMSDSEGSPFPNLLAVFIPHWVKRLQEKYYEGRQEAERELNQEEPDGVRPPTA